MGDRLARAAGCRQAGPRGGSVSEMDRGQLLSRALRLVRWVEARPGQTSTKYDIAPVLHTNLRGALRWGHALEELGLAKLIEPGGPQVQRTWEATP